MTADLEFDDPTSAPRGETGLIRIPVLWPVLIGVLIGSAFYFLVALLLLHVVIGGSFQTEPFACRVMSDPINLFSIVAFTTAIALLWARGRFVRRENTAFELEFLPGGGETLILPDDALGFRKRLRQLEAWQKRLVLFRLLSAGLQRARGNWSSEDAGAAVTTQAQLIQSDVESQYSLIRYLAWAIPSLGFIGTVLGIGEAMGSLNIQQSDEAGQSALDIAAGHLHTAFDTTFVALVLSLILMFFVYRVQAREDSLLARAVDWCMQRFVFRMHIASPSPVADRERA